MCLCLCVMKRRASWTGNWFLSVKSLSVGLSHVKPECCSASVPHVHVHTQSIYVKYKHFYCYIYCLTLAKKDFFLQHTHTHTHTHTHAPSQWAAICSHQSSCLGSPSGLGHKSVTLSFFLSPSLSHHAQANWLRAGDHWHWSNWVTSLSLSKTIGEQLSTIYIGKFQNM